MVEDVTPVTPRPIGRAMLSQSWVDATFLHWRIEPGRAARLLPPGVSVDLFDGDAHVGLVAFGMVGTRLLGSPPIPWLGTFRETNVRLYTVDGRGRRAVLFRWMAADRLAPALAGRALLGLPYRWTPMTLEKDASSGEPRVAYTCARPASRVVVAVGDDLPDPSPLERFLTCRWGLHTRAFGATRHLANQHPPWPLRRARLLACDDGLLAAAGLPGVADRPPDSVLHSPGVPAEFGPVRRDRRVRTR